MITRKNNAFVAKIVNTHLTKGFIAIFAPAESLPSPATLLTTEPFLDLDIKTMQNNSLSQINFQICIFLSKLHEFRNNYVDNYVDHTKLRKFYV